MMAEWSKAVDLRSIQVSTGATRVSSNLTHVNLCVYEFFAPLYFQKMKILRKALF